MSILIIGAGTSGQGMAKYLQKDYFFVDDDPMCALANFSSPEEVPWELVTQVIVSSGISDKSPWLSAVKELGLKVIGEAQFALDRLKSSRLVAVTGTNGKTTTALFAAHVLRTVGLDATACGNVGFSLGEFLCQPSAIGVVELSSFQLTRIDGRFFESALVLDITPDHLDWHGSMESYAVAKARIAYQLKPGGKTFVTALVKQNFGQFFPPDISVVPSICAESLFCATSALVAPFGLSLSEIESAWATFKMPGDRLELVDSVEGIRYINDSKATNFAALSYALSRYSNDHLVLILSGIPKEPSLDGIDLSAADEIVVFGEMSRLAPKRAHRAESLEEAVEIASRLARPSGVVLFSPGGSSFDCFENYIDRGRQFKYTTRKYLLTGELGL